MVYWRVPITRTKLFRLFILGMSYLFHFLIFRIETFSILNVPDINSNTSSKILSIHAFFVFLISLIIYLFLFRFHAKYLEIRNRSESDSIMSDALAARTILVSNIPKSLQDQTALELFFRKLPVYIYLSFK